MHRVVIIAAVFGLLVAGCGQAAEEGEEATPTPTGGDPATVTESPVSPSPTGTAEGTPVAIEGPVTNRGTREVSGSTPFALDEFFFEPTFITGDPGAEITLNATNEGTVLHTFVLREQNIDVELREGEERAIEVELPEQGQTLRFICRIHEAQGMVGALFVR